LKKFKKASPSCKTKIKLVARPFVDGGYEYIELTWNAVPGALDYTVFSNGDGWSNLPNFKVEAAKKRKKVYGQR